MIGGVIILAVFPKVVIAIKDVQKPGIKKTDFTIEMNLDWIVINDILLIGDRRYMLEQDDVGYFLIHVTDKASELHYIRVKPNSNEAPPLVLRNDRTDGIYLSKYGE